MSQVRDEKNRRPHTLLAVFIALTMLIFALSIWTLIPLGWIWIGSQLAATQFPSIGPYILVLFGIIGTVLGRQDMPWWMPMAICYAGSRR